MSGETLIADLYPSEEQGAPLSFATAGGIFEVALIIFFKNFPTVGIGMLLGPFIGGSFYEIRKQKTDPFWLALSMVIVDGIGRLLIKEPSRAESETNQSALNLLKEPVIILFFIQLILSAIGASGLYLVLKETIIDLESQRFGPSVSTLC